VDWEIVALAEINDVWLMRLPTARVQALFRR
jgi:hypothetical protein